MHESTDPDREGWYEVESIICAGCMALEKDTHDHEPGARRVVRLDPKYVKRS